MAYTPPRKITGTMPFSYCKDDAQWINEKLSKLNPSERARIANAYGRAYQEASDLEPVDYKKSGKGRFEANKRLLKFVK